MEKKSVSSAVIKSVVLVVLGALVILGIYLIFNRNKNVAKEEDYVLTAVDEITTTDLSKSYPADARMIVSFYAKIMQTLYKETYTEEQEDKMISVLAGIMDDELLANQSDFNKAVKNEVQERKAGDYSISTYVVQTKEPEVVKIDGSKMCNVDCLFTLRKGTTHTATYYQYVMRQDDEGKWKILGWTIKEDE
ncbi:MAG: hypothetical protein IJR29_08175 [Butyrivibrio sp.]|nr:hypothetical protein [Butyrivibrio sp.]